MRNTLNKWIDRYRLSVARYDAVPQLALLGIVAGLLAGITIILFRLLLHWFEDQLTVGAHFTVLSPEYRFLLPLTGGLILGVLFQFLSRDDRRVGILHIMDRLAHHQGNLPWRNAVVQFIAGIISIVSGHSVGREGPSAHLGAASSNLPAQALHLPHNSLRVTAACGTAAGIAASFNTPLAGVAFAMEVLMSEYTVAGFTPVILATVSATMLTRWVFGHKLMFSVPEVNFHDLAQLPYTLIVGIAMGVLGAAFLVTVKWVSRHSQRIPVWLSFSAAGGIVGLCGLLVPQVMGVGDTTITDALNGHYGMQLLLLILLFKMIASSACVGVGIPAGIIGPSLVIGAAAGALFALLGPWLGIDSDRAVALYALAGMASTMAAILQAPLAGLIAMLELTGSHTVILPGMLAVVTATVTAGLLTRRESVFQALMRQLGLDYRDDPLTQSLRRMGVAAVMDRAFVELPPLVERDRADRELGSDPRWLLVREADQMPLLLTAVDLVRALKNEPEQNEFDLRKLPAQRMESVEIDMQANLQEAYQRIQETGAGALYVVRMIAPGIKHVYGILTTSMIEQAYRY